MAIYRNIKEFYEFTELCGLDSENIKSKIKSKEYILEIVTNGNIVIKSMVNNRATITDKEISHLKKLLNYHKYLAEDSTETDIIDLFHQYDGYSTIFMMLPKRDHPLWSRFDINFKNEMYYWSKTKEGGLNGTRGIDNVNIARYAMVNNIPIEEFMTNGSFMYSDSHTIGAINEYLDINMRNVV